ncbi:MAG: PP2C family protein-serine/threonine phosphatase [Tepidisphaerales bacterium]
MTSNVRDEFESELQRTRARWVRRRILWLLAVTLALTLLVMPSEYAKVTTSPDGPARHAALLRLGWMALGGVLAVACGAWVLAIRYRPGAARTTSHIALGLMAFIGLLSMPVERLATHLEGERIFLDVVSKAGPQGQQLVVRGADAIPPRPADDTSPEAAATSPDPAAAFPRDGRGEASLAAQTGTVLHLAILAIGLALSAHLLPCLFMPWTVRESLVPAAAVLAGTVGVLAFDVVGGSLGWTWATAIALGTVSCLVPGALLCWWRYTRFRGDYRLRFESGRYKELRGELSAARRIHESTLPPMSLPGPAWLAYRYRPTRDVGGDMLTVRELDGGRRMVVLLDVTGHGITAALMVNRLIGELDRLLAGQPPPGPGGLLRGLNRYASLLLGPHGLFLSAIAAEFDPYACRMRYASAGHPTAYLRRCDGSMEELRSTGLLLGVVEPREFELDEMTLTLTGGEVFLLCTDGATETRDARGVPLLTAGLAMLFAEAAATAADPPELAERLMDEVDRYRHGDVEDDTLLVVVTVQHPTDRPA